MSNDLISAEDAIKDAPPGMMIYARVSTDNAGAQETAFLIREEQKFVRAFGHNPVVEMRAGLLYEDAPGARRVALVPVMLRIGAGKDAQLYECWFNFHGADNRASFADLAAQPASAIFFFVPERSKAVRVQNGLRALFAETRGALEAMPAWSMGDFDAAREKIYRAYPTPHDLWRALAGGGGSG